LKWEFYLPRIWEFCLPLPWEFCLPLPKGGTNDDRVKLEAVKDVLDRVGLKPVEKREYTGEIGFNLLNVDMSKYPKVENGSAISTKNRRPKKGD